MQDITLLDYVLLPFFLGLIYFIAVRIRNNKYPAGHPWRKYFIPALSVKLFSAVVLGLIYAYYYGYADSFGFFRHSKIINSALSDSPEKWINLVFHIPNQDDPYYYRYISELPWYNVDLASYIVAVVAAILGLFTMNTYLPTSVLFAFISFSGVWALFRTFATLYTKFTKQIATCFLFIPSVALWGSGILKDTLSIFALGWFTYFVFRLLIQKDLRVKNFLWAIVCFFLLADIKVYILLAYLPALGLWILLTYTSRIKVAGVRFIVKVVSFILIIGSSFYFMQVLSDKLGIYSLNKITDYAGSLRGWISYSTERDEGSGYSLGVIEPTTMGTLMKFPQAVNVTFFRPYLWESKKPIVLFSALESLLFLFVTLKVLFVVGFQKAWRTVLDDPTIQFCLLFSIVFAFAVGITTYNFGTLSRYKIPCLPFYAMAIILVYYKNVQPPKKLLPFL